MVGWRTKGHLEHRDIGCVSGEEGGHVFCQPSGAFSLVTFMIDIVFIIIRFGLVVVVFAPTPHEVDEVSVPAQHAKVPNSPCLHQGFTNPRHV